MIKFNFKVIGILTGLLTLILHPSAQSAEKIDTSSLQPSGNTLTDALLQKNAFVMNNEQHKIEISQIEVVNIVREEIKQKLASDELSRDQEAVFKSLLIGLKPESFARSNDGSFQMQSMEFNKTIQGN